MAAEKSKLATEQEARDVAEAAREAEWENRSFARALGDVPRFLLGGELSLLFCHAGAPDGGSSRAIPGRPTRSA